ncbi:uncharacterized protein LOC142587846 isoform X2 [Dermacentor variabilis]|uniref:uncharacterized protein LOC142587846 isoform X2 n=1 Tax=Dermacentor variabilis TaxID=34621 RepID=UPI003F5B2BC4
MYAARVPYSRRMCMNLRLASLLLLGFFATVARSQKNIKGKPLCPPTKCLQAAEPEICCFAGALKCDCHCVKTQRHCTTESTKYCGKKGLPVCTKELGKTICQCLNRGKQKPELPPKKPESSGQPSCKLTKCYNPAMPQNCCLMSNNQCYCNCVAAKTECKSVWAKSCGAKAVPVCTVQTQRTMCKCIPGQQLPAPLPSTGAGKAGQGSNEQGGTLPSSCPSTQCAAKTNKTCCLVTEKGCKCVCVMVVTSCSIAWKETCKLPSVTKCDKANGERMCQCVRQPQLPQGKPVQATQGGLQGTNLGRQCASSGCEKGQKKCCFASSAGCTCRCVYSLVRCSTAFLGSCADKQEPRCETKGTEEVCACADQLKASSNMNQTNSNSVSTPARGKVT